MKHNTDSILFRCTISGPSALIICPILCIGMLIAIVICSYYLAVIPLLLLCIPLYPLIGLGLWSTWKESAVLIITDKVVCLMRHGKTITSFPQDYTPCNGMTDPSKSFISVHFLTIRMRNGRQRKAGLIANWQQKSTRRRTGREHIALQLTGHHIGLLCCRKMFQCFLKRIMLYSE